MLNKLDSEVLRKNLSFWEKLSNNEKNLVINKSISKSFTKNSNIYEGLDDCKGLIFVKKGQLRAYILSESGKEITLYRLFQNDICIMSASCVLKNITFDINLEAEKDSEIIIIPTDVYLDISNNNIEVQKFTNENAMSRFSDVMWIMEQVLFMSFDKRLAIFLLDQSIIDKSDRINLTHEDIAKHMGSAREVVSRMLKYFQNEGLVKTERGSIIITNQKKLRELII